MIKTPREILKCPLQPLPKVLRNIRFSEQRRWNRSERVHPNVQGEDLLGHNQVDSCQASHDQQRGLLLLFCFWILLLEGNHFCHFCFCCCCCHCCYYGCFWIRTIKSAPITKFIYMYIFYCSRCDGYLNWRIPC